jgi:hypothetical protein
MNDQGPWFCDVYWHLVGEATRHLLEMKDAHDTRRFERQPTSGHRGVTALIRIIIAVCLLPALVYLCLQTDHGRAKGMPMESWRLAPLILGATVCGLLGKRFLNSVAGVFLGGIGGVFGTLDQFAGPYGGVVGLVVGAIVVALPICDKPRSTVTPVAPTPISPDNEPTAQDAHGPP